MNDTATSPPLPTGVQPGGRFDRWEPRATRYVVCDVDGTLIGPSSDASDEVVAAVARAGAAGLRVGYATGRMRDAVAALHRQLDAPGPHLLHNGAEIRADGTTIAAWSLSAEDVDQLLALAEQHDELYVEIYAESGFHASAWDERARRHWEILGAEPLGIVRRASDLDTEIVPKATFATFSEAALSWLLEQLDRLDLEVGHAGSPLTPGLSFVNVSEPGATKGAALRRAADHLGVPMSEVAAIGDAANDLSMFEVVGTAIAMGQAPSAIREAAHLIVPEVDQHGVASALDALATWPNGS